MIASLVNFVVSISSNIVPEKCTVNVIISWLQIFAVSVKATYSWVSFFVISKNNERHVVLKVKFVGFFSRFIVHGENSEN